MNTKVAENHEPGDTWEFSEAVTEAFPQMLRASVPGYEDMRRWINMLTHTHLKHRGPDVLRVLELGASRGESLVPLQSEFINIELTAIDNSEPMCTALRKIMPYANVYNLDLNTQHEDITSLQKFDVVYCILTLMFTDPLKRALILESVYKSLKPGGMLILVEKTLGDYEFADKFLTETYYDYKAENGYTRENIERKRMSLENVLIPFPSWRTEAYMHGAKFIHIQPFWRALQFCGWMAFKSDKSEQPIFNVGRVNDL